METDTLLETNNKGFSQIIVISLTFISFISLSWLCEYVQIKFKSVFQYLWAPNHTVLVI